MKRILSILFVTLICIPNMSVYGNTENVRSKIDLFPNDNKVVITDYNNEQFEIDNSSKKMIVTNINGVTYISFKLLNYFLKDDSVIFVFDEKKSIGYTTYKYPQYEPEDWLDIKIFGNSNDLIYKGESIKLEKPTIVLDGELYIPLRTTLNSFGYSNNDIRYNFEDRDITVVNIKKSLLESYVDEDSLQFIIKKDVFYEMQSKNYDEIERYIKENINSTFILKDYEVSELEDASPKFNLLVFNYKVDNIISDFGYQVIIQNSRARIVESFGVDISKNPPTIDVKSLLTDEELRQMALAELNKNAIIDEQRIYKFIDSSDGRIKYKVETVVGTDESGFSCIVFEY